ncbi:MAG: DsbA family oxidoreductase [Alphaproteobacteria bacterium]|jgi:predicted DsbA family dithiol-disulfide isomerase|nr:DsbA family oxidoreductase [Alphaproteobacteria bacterium]
MVHIDIYSDPVCPWCYIGKRRLERTLSARDDLKVDIKWHPYLLNPDMPLSGMDQTSYLIYKYGGLERAIKFQDIISETGQGERLALNFDQIQNTPNTINAHRLIRLADNYGLQNEIVEALFTAYFKNGEDIGDHGVLIRIGHSIGLDSKISRSYLSSNKNISYVTSQDLRARRMNISAVPYFIINKKYAISGAQEPEAFFPLLDLALMSNDMTSDVSKII